MGARGKTNFASGSRKQPCGTRNFTPCLRGTKPSPGFNQTVVLACRLENEADYAGHITASKFYNNTGCRCCRVEMMLGLGGQLASQKVKRRSGWRTKRKGAAKGSSGESFYLSLEPSFSISSCRGANSRLSIKLNSWQGEKSNTKTKGATQLRETHPATARVLGVAAASPREIQAFQGNTTFSTVLLKSHVQSPNRLLKYW